MGDLPAREQNVEVVEIGVVGNEKEPQGRIFNDEQMEEIRQTGGTSESQPGRLTVWFRKIIKKADEGIGDLFESLEEKNEEQATKE